MNDRLIDRLLVYMRYKGLNNNQLTILAGLSAGLIGKAKTGVKGLSSVSVEKILRVCPDLNARWLLTGEGTMLPDSQSEPLARSAIPPAAAAAFTPNELHGGNAQAPSDSSHLLERISYLEKTVADKERIIALYERLLQQK